MDPEYKMSIYEQLLAKNMGVIKIQHMLNHKIHVLLKRESPEHHIDNLKEYGYIIFFEGESLS
jgi:hypothetical protein